MNTDSAWQEYWLKYGPESTKDEDDLFKQVGHTSSQRPISKEQVNRMVEHTVTQLQLSESDYLLDFCCGNGIFSHELAKRVRHVTGVDFIPRILNNAICFKSGSNINYVLGNATAPLHELIELESIPNKFLMIHALGYFTPVQLEGILTNIVRHIGGTAFRFLIMGIPSDELKWNFYSTPERRERYLANHRTGDDANDGIGRWWLPSEITEVCRRLNLNVRVENQAPALSNYRMDALISA